RSAARAFLPASPRLSVSASRLSSAGSAGFFSVWSDMMLLLPIAGWTPRPHRTDGKKKGLEDPAVEAEHPAGVGPVLRDLKDAFGHEPWCLEAAAGVLRVPGPPHRLTSPPAARHALGRELHAPPVHLRLTDITGGPVRVDELV